MIKTMDQEEKMDFKALRAKFQEEELLLKQPRIKPAIPVKPKVIPPPQSPIHHLPTGARPSLLTSINHTLESNSVNAPRVVFKDDKPESKKPLIQPLFKRDKNEEKLKKDKDKYEKLKEVSSDQKQKKETVKKEKERTGQLVPATPPPKPDTPKKRFLGFRVASKKGSSAVPVDSFLDAVNSEIPGPAPLIPVSTGVGDAAPESQPSRPKALLPNIPTLPDPSAAVESTPPFVIPASPEFTPPPAFIPDIPVPDVPITDSENLLEIETPALPPTRPDSTNESIPSPPNVIPTPPPSIAFSYPNSVASTPSPSLPESEVATVASMKPVNMDEVETPPLVATEPPSHSPPSPKAAPTKISPLSALERAGDMSQGKRTHCDQRIFNALEKARRKKTSVPTNSTTFLSMTPPSEEQQSTTLSAEAFPPTDYDRASMKSAEVNSFGQASPDLEVTSEEGSEPVPELLVIPPPPPRKVLPAIPVSAVLPPVKAESDPSVSLREFIPSSLVDNEILAPSELSDAGTTDIPEKDCQSDAGSLSPYLPASDWGNGEFSGPDSPDGPKLPQFFGNGTIPHGGKVRAEPVPGGPEYNGQTGLGAQVDNGVYEITTGNMYEVVPGAGAKKKGKTDLIKKRKGPPKNPYAAATQEINEEKSKTIRLFNKNDKKAAIEGPDEKELKKREKQRLEKEKKELKEKQEREKKEQKEKEKRESEMKKTFKITGQEDAMYEAKVTVTTKGRKYDLPVKEGDLISIIRTTNCPKGKWLARDSNQNYGYVAVEHVELDIKEMLEMGKKSANYHKTVSSVSELDIASSGSRTSNHFPVSTESFTDDSEEWTGDDDEPLNTAPDNADSLASIHNRTQSMPEMGNKDLSINHQHSHSDIDPDGRYIEGRHEALQKLATFFHSSKPGLPSVSAGPETSPVFLREEVDLPEASSTQDVDFDPSDMIILPPPELYADFTTEE
ncbi:FYN-binding protein 1 isoform X2 [Antennarius striatus]|uniref:FYN-binding protein 1 isoform X2 n=1 Tax=Antennarius striatus TaxID=241820 RepID=UPI0035AF165E